MSFFRAPDRGAWQAYPFGSARETWSQVATRGRLRFDHDRLVPNLGKLLGNNARGDVDDFHPESLDLGVISEYPCIGQAAPSGHSRPINGAVAGTGIGDVTGHVPVRCGGMACCAQGGVAGARDCERRPHGGRLHDVRSAGAGDDRYGRIGAAHRRLRVD